MASARSGAHPFPSACSTASASPVVCKRSASLSSGSDDGDELDLVELALAQHPPGVAPRRPRLGAEEIGGELRQMRRPRHRGVAHEQRWQGLQMAAGLGGEIEHHLPERPLQAGRKSGEDGEARPRQVRGRFRVEAEAPAEIDVVARREGEGDRRTPLA